LTAAVLFALYAAAAGMLAPAMLRGPWAARSPQLAMTLWLVLPVSWVAAIALAILAATAPLPLTWPGSPRGGGQVLLAGRAVPGGRAIAIAGVLVAAAVVLRAAGCAARELHRGRRDRREHAALVAATGHLGDEPDVAIVDHDAPAVYCLPRGRHQIVISAGALAALTPAQLRAVLAHERAHLRRRHHMILALAAALAHAFPQVPLLSQAPPQLAALAEMAADDAALRCHRRDDLAAALVILATAGARPATLAASGPEAIVRLQRLLAPRQPRAGVARLAAIAGLIPPVVIACLPLIVAACDITSHP
jgi:beta-lactamase regulating signal transducer with metallopeptidase domain